MMRFAGRRRRALPALPAVALVASVACAPVYSANAPPASMETSEAREAPTLLAPVGGDSDEGSVPPKAALVRALETLVWPLASDGSGLLSSRYGDRVHPTGGDRRFHGGLDLRAREGTPVYAAADGVVSTSGTSGAYGSMVVVDHAGGLQTLYAHHQRNLVEAGDPVRRGQPIALVGHSGNATGDHLHFEVRWDGGTVDPRTILPILSGSAGR
jgi:murein DD-endopeptidase MepM/ murein hydrolase activator NlpD